MTRIMSRPFARLAAVAAAGVLAASALAGCSSPSTEPVLPPIMKNVNELQGATVEVPIDTVLVINTESLATDSYEAEIADSSIVTFVQGSDKDGLVTNPGFEPKKEGETTVTMTNEQGGIQPLEFTIVVTGPSNGTGN